MLKLVLGFMLLLGLNLGGEGGGWLYFWGCGWL